MTQEDGGLVAYAAAIAGWHRRHRFCANCGTPTHSGEAGHVRGVPELRAIHHPRTDPVVIMLVHDGERALLGRQPQWPEGRYSALAGFVEPGESLEEAVAREVLEEAGVEVGDVLYRSSQPWPFPSSLMLGFHAAYADGEATVARPRARRRALVHRDELAEIAARRHRLPPAAAAGDRRPPDRRVVDRRAGPLSSLSPERDAGEWTGGFRRDPGTERREHAGAGARVAARAERAVVRGDRGRERLGGPYRRGGARICAARSARARHPAHGRGRERRAQRRHRAGARRVAAVPRRRRHARPRRARAPPVRGAPRAAARRGGVRLGARGARRHALRRVHLGGGGARRSSRWP